MAASSRGQRSTPFLLLLVVYVCEVLLKQKFKSGGHPIISNPCTCVFWFCYWILIFLSPIKDLKRVNLFHLGFFPTSNDSSVFAIRRLPLKTAWKKCLVFLETGLGQ